MYTYPHMYTHAHTHLYMHMYAHRRTMNSHPDTGTRGTVAMQSVPRFAHTRRTPSGTFLFFLIESVIRVHLPVIYLHPLYDKFSIFAE